MAQKTLPTASKLSRTIGVNTQQMGSHFQNRSAIQSITASMDDKQRSTARSTYLAMLDEHDRLLTRASLRGQPGHVEPGIREEQYKEVINSEAGLSVHAPE